MSLREQLAESRAQTLLDWYDARTAETEHDGRHWYERTARHIRSMAAGVPHVDPSLLVLAVAVMSANTHWDNLLAAVPEWIREPWTAKVPAYPSLVRKAELILAGDAWEPIVPFKTSPKLHSFCKALLGDRSSVVVDLWMVRACRTGPGGFAPSKVGALTLNEYEAHRRAIVLASKETEHKPRDFQAVVWCTVRDAHTHFRREER